MSEQQTVKLFHGITDISEEIIEEARTDRSPHHKKRPAWVKWGAAAACLCLIAAGALVWRHASSPAPAASGITVSEEGVTLPHAELPRLSSNASASWAYAFFFYQGNRYIWYQPWDAGVSEDVIGEYLGTAYSYYKDAILVGVDDDRVPTWDNYVELAGNCNGDVYTVKGYDPDFLVCADVDGMLCYFIRNSNITLKTGADLYEERLHLSERCYAVQYETQASWNSDKGEVYQLNDPTGDAVTNFIAALDEGAFQIVRDLAEGDEAWRGLWDQQIYHVRFLTENGPPVYLRLCEGGYVLFDLSGLSDICVQVPEPQFSALIDLLSDPDAGTLTE